MDFARWLRGIGKIAERRLKFKPQTVLSRLLHASVFKWDRIIAARGVAIGLFWAAIPMPFQMVPATVFCMLFRGHLPLAIGCVWISNPLTYVPMIAFEYAIGRLLMGLPDINGPDVGHVSGDLWLLLQVHLQQMGVPVLVGAFALGTAAAVGGYLVVYLLWKERIKAGLRRAARIVKPHHGKPAK